MRLESGSRIGSYQILAPAGAGGMGEVYLARDVKLGRQVAIKVLPEEVGRVQELLDRFEREARLLAALNHPNVATLYGLEHDGEQPFLVMELVEGETLAERIARGPIPWDEVRSLFLQIAEGLEAAHKQGIIHRDLKPANIKITPEGQVKILDFGLAKALAPETDVLDAPSQSPTLTQGTRVGAILGTAAYMSPEQTRGQTVDRRTDVWAFGCCLYEALTGKRTFQGETVPDVFSAVLNKEPDWSQLPAGSPSAARHVLERTLRKDVSARLQHVGDARIELLDSGDEKDSATRASAGSRTWIAAAILVTALVATVLAVTVFRRNDANQPAPAVAELGPIRSMVVLPFKSLMNDPDEDYFVEGMHEALITQLSKISSLDIISQRTAMHYAGSDKPLRQIAQELNVDAAVEGSVLKAGDIVRVTVTLIDARNDRHIWADNFDRELIDILALYNEVTREISDQVQATVVPAESDSLQAPAPIDPVAYELYLKGRYFCENWSPQEMRQGAEFLQLAIERAPDFAAPHASLAMCLVDSAFFEYVLPGDIDLRARTAAMKAVQLDDRLAEAHVALGSVRYYLDFEPEAAESEYLRALDLDGNSVDSLLRLSWLYAESDRFYDALGPTLRAVELDPLSTAVRNALGQVYHLNRDIDLAIENFEEALSLDRSDPSLHYYVGLAYEQKGDYEEAIARFEAASELSDDAPLYLSALGHALGLAGDRDRALQILEHLEQAESPPPFGLAVVHLGLGNNERALGLLEEAVAVRSFHTLYLKAGPRFDTLRDEPGFNELLRRIGH